jgi:hypothetical protein
MTPSISPQVVRIDVHKDRLIVALKSAGTEESHSTDGQLLSIPWQKPRPGEHEVASFRLMVRQTAVRTEAQFRGAGRPRAQVAPFIRAVHPQQDAI